MAGNPVLLRAPKDKKKDSYEVSIGGLYDDWADVEKRDTARLVGWCVGDIDFDEDGAVFIRNPYLANAIERQLEINARGPKGMRDKPFKLVRDKGFSGEKLNMVC